MDIFTNLSNPLLFALFAKEDPNIWRTLKGQRIHHIDSGEGEIKNITGHQKGDHRGLFVEIQFTNGSRLKLTIFSKENSERREQLCQFLNGKIIELTFPDELQAALLNFRSGEKLEINDLNIDLRLLERIRVQTAREAQLAREQTAHKARREALIARLNEGFRSDFLTADQTLANEPDATLLSDAEYQALRIHFVKDWAQQELDLTLDSEQAAAIGSTGGDVQVVARAGSGKTRTLVTRAIFLQKHCGVSPRELLLLAFNKKAAAEMRQRLSQTLGEDLPHVMTFDALAHALVHPNEELVSDDASVGRYSLSREVQEVIDEHLESEQYRGRIRSLMLAYFRDDWERIEDWEHDSLESPSQNDRDAYLAQQRAHPHESLNGEYVKSFGEKVIANALFEHSIDYQYEHSFPRNGGNYRPDFTLPKERIVIEYFGLTGRASYDKSSEWKRHYWAGQEEWRFLEFSQKDLTQHGVGTFTSTLLQKLQAMGVSYQRRSEEEIWGLIRRRALNDRFTKSMKIFINRCRSQAPTSDDLSSMAAGHIPCSTAESLFLNVGISVYQGYLQRLGASEKEDFGGLMWRAVSLIREGKMRFTRDKGRERGDLNQLRFVLIDEFQDFSRAFFALVGAIRSANPHMRFFCVGDDWQAINGFAGSDLRFFNNFPAYFQEAELYYLRTNYRSPRLVVEVGNAVMQGHGRAAVPSRADTGVVEICRLDQFRMLTVERSQHQGDTITPAVLRLIRRFLARGQDVVMLSRLRQVHGYIRYNDRFRREEDELTRFHKHIQSFLPLKDGERVTMLNVHRYKGLEQSAVIVLDAIEGCYPMVHPAWIFQRIFGDSIERIVDQERRLFYVAVTRAKESLVLVTESRIESPYLADICQKVRLGEA